MQGEKRPTFVEGTLPDSVESFLDTVSLSELLVQGGCEPERRVHSKIDCGFDHNLGACGEEGTA